MIGYLLKVIACSGLLYAFYYCFLQKEKMLVFNRCYLLGALLFSMVIPLVTFTIWVPSSPALPAAETAFYGLAAAPAAGTNASSLYTLEKIILPIIIAAGTLYFLFRFLKGLVGLYRITKQSEPLVWNNTAVRLHGYAMTPYSAAGKIFLNKKEWESGKVEEAILLHEKAHIRQRHFYDVLFMELMQLCFWFNPFIYLFKKAVKLNHEYLADTAVVMVLAARGRKQEREQQEGNVPANQLLLAEASVAYQQLLLQSVYVNQSIPLASSFYFFTTKKRLLMLQRKTSFLMAVGKAAMILPLTGGLVFLFAGRTYAQKEKPVIISTTVSEVRRDSRQPNDVESLTVTTSKDKTERTAVLKYKNGMVVREDISTKVKADAFEKKYGVKNPPPPPPPFPPQELNMRYDIKSLAVVTPGGRPVAILEYKNGEKVKADISSPKKKAAFENSYGVKIPTPPPPPPPAPRETLSASKPSVTFVAVNSQTSASTPKPQHTFAAEPLSVPVEKRVASTVHTPATQPLVPVPAGQTPVKEVRRSEGQKH